MSRLIDLDALLDELADRIAARLRSAPATAPAPAPDSVLTIAAAAKAYAVTAAWLRAEIRIGRLPALHAGRQLRVRLADVEALMSRAPEAAGRTVDELLRRRGGR